MKYNFKSVDLKDFIEIVRIGYYDRYYVHYNETYGTALMSPRKNSDLKGWTKVYVPKMLCVRPIIMLKASDAEKYMIDV